MKLLDLNDQRCFNRGRIARINHGSTWSERVSSDIQQLRWISPLETGEELFTRPDAQGYLCCVRIFGE
jgi:hypothetical protein